MGPLDFINHLLNFAAPALAVAWLLVIFSRFYMKKGAHPGSFWTQFAINFGVGAGALVVGLLFFGRDGKMLSYLALVLAMATSQWWQLGGWKKWPRSRGP